MTKEDCTSNSEYYKAEFLRRCREDGAEAVGVLKRLRESSAETPASDTEEKR